ncbi:MAG: transketolase [Ignavibacteriota bacterium]|nr:MAG: transketolase [Chlorobiota bacterium]MBE7476037.1 transketolase [Ignavibacteriales bacterium]MBL1123158.1 transketolase [Ignavibacteriota bacterium]MCE7857142.1 transketolase [Ignavibacteria bacterium CHB3]MEB2297337.1 transketolase [Ignavibacteria bacterium]GJQ41111.1 MAG: transketolase [Ignavibacteriaceae bacterium]
MSNKDINQLSINTIRFLAVDAVQKANSGHPGMPMGCAPIAYRLYTKYMKHNPANSHWLNRDRFILSAGHGSMLLYSILHLCGYKISMNDLKSFRQWKSITPGHPEFGLTDGVETTTGPLGQGFSNAVGMAIAQEYLASLFNKPEIKILDHFIYGICSDGDLMEGISHEAASLAGHLKLSKLIFFYDDNGITIDGKTSLAFSEDIKKRFEAYHWQVLTVNDVNDISQIDKAVEEAQKEKNKPTLIITKTNIGFGSPNKQDSASAHGSPLGEAEVKLTKKNLGWWEDKFFYIPDEVSDHFNQLKNNFSNYEDEWNKLFETYKKKYPNAAEQFVKVFNYDFGDLWINALPAYTNYSEKIATRSASGKVINSIVEYLPTLIGGSADLHPSNDTYINNSSNFSAENRAGRNFHFGIREHGMGGVLNGMAIYGGLIPYGGTFLIFSDYMRPSIRLASLSGVRPIYIYTHDSVGLGEDGPTHQPIEHLASLRAIPKLIVIRPADANETVEAWKFAIEHKGSPVAIALTRQKIPVIDRTKFATAENLSKGAYVLNQSEKNPEVILMASGSEVSLALEAFNALQSEGIKTRVVSFPSWEIFEAQSGEYKESVFPKSVKARISIEAGVKQGWEKYIGDFGEAISIEKFGASAPYEIIFKEYGFTKEAVVVSVKRVLGKIQSKNKV